MDTVPPLFIESVCLRLQNRRSLWTSSEIGSIWGEVSFASRAKIYTLRVIVKGAARKLYATAQNVHSWEPERAVPLDRVNLTSIINFYVDEVYNNRPLPSSWKEISLDELERLAHFISPTGYERRPIHYDDGSSNKLHLRHMATNPITGKLLLMRLPVDSVTLSIFGGNEAEVDEFFEHVGPLYDVSIMYSVSTRPALQQSTVDVIIDKFVPVYNGGLLLHKTITREQLERLVVKCEMSGEQVGLNLVHDDPEERWDAMELFDFDRYRWVTVEVPRKGERTNLYSSPGFPATEYGVASVKSMSILRSATRYSRSKSDDDGCDASEEAEEEPLVDILQVGANGPRVHRSGGSVETPICGFEIDPLVSELVKQKSVSSVSRTSDVELLKTERYGHRTSASVTLNDLKMEMEGDLDINNGLSLAVGVLEVVEMTATHSATTIANHIEDGAYIRHVDSYSKPVFVFSLPTKIKYL
uniref:SH2 domain-containing protein n=1 Tax=Steinernema glaseri TaxID=37863 RepID=A0A1I7YIW4_9BILA